MRALKGVIDPSDFGISALRFRMAAWLSEQFGAVSVDACFSDAGRDPVWMADLIAQREAEAGPHGPMFIPLRPTLPNA